MTFKPFRPPAFRKSEQCNEYEATSSSKRRKLSPVDDDDDDSINRQTRPPASASRQPLTSVANPPSPPKPKTEEDNAGRQYFSIVWRKVTAKKNKTWEEDGLLSCRNGSVTVYNSKGAKIGSIIRDKPLEIEDMLKVSGKEIQIEAPMSRAEFDRIIGKVDVTTTSKTAPVAAATSRPAPKMSLQEMMRQQIQEKSKAKKTALIPTSRNAAFRNPVKDSQVLPQVPSELPIPRHDPNSPDALVFTRPKRVPSGKQVVDVVLDPMLTKNLRPHQREGIKFLYECVMGHRNFGGQGCVLADDMGLGKTLQSIALIWTLLKQNPVYKEPPVIKKVLIVCPVTLTMNWKKEFRKWLGRDRIGVMCFGDEGSRLTMFDGKNFQVMIVGYERLTKIAEDLNKGAPIDLIICDEGHRLKTLQNKTAKAIETLNTPRRVILSGTPIQNDLTELFAMVNFVNDGVLGSAKAFAKDFEKPILKSRQPNATDADIEKGQDASTELAQTTSQFILRRTADVLSGHLPVKTEYVLFCRPTQEQAQVYREVLQTPMFASAMRGTSNESALQMITILKKLCNSPVLLRPTTGADEATPSSSLTTLGEMMPRGLSRFYHNAYAAKIRLLDELLQQIKNHTDDKVVLVSNYTSTLDLIQNVISNSGMQFRRLDGSVSAKKRMALVDEFNRLPQKTCHAFLLSAKAGGVGINLIGANRLILFDVDWNPAVEDQAMARIHRDGQTKQCYIYRLLIKGGIEERIWQRQVVKRGLADSIMDSGPGASDTGATKGKGQAAFSADELRDLFRLDESDGLRTHELIGCQCQGNPTRPASPVSREEIDEVDDIDDLESDQASSPVKTFSFTPASQISTDDLEEQEISIRRGSSPQKPSKNPKQQSKELQELLKYAHIDTQSFPSLTETDREQVESVVDDLCLTKVLNKSRDDMPGNIAYVFLRRSKATELSLNDGEDSEVVVEQK